MTKLKLGTVDIALPATVVSSAVESFGFFELPYLPRRLTHSVIPIGAILSIVAESLTPLSSHDTLIHR